MPGGGLTRLWCAQKAVHSMQAEADERWPLETGGVLLGYLSTATRQVVLTAAVGPGPNAQHFATGFIPDYDYQEREVADAYLASGRITTYLGDWHTHPNVRLRLSRTDGGTLRRIAAHKDARAANPLMVILAGYPSRWSVGVWQWRRGWLRVSGKPVVVEDLRYF
jgi:integrative and conjugative element protein (TIGR02256 family)